MMVKSDAERLASVETRLGEIDKMIDRILEEQRIASARAGCQQTELEVLTTKLQNLLDKLEELTNKRFNLANVLIGTCSVLILVLNLLITMPAIKNANRIAQEQLNTYSLSKP